MSVLLVGVQDCTTSHRRPRARRAQPRLRRRRAWPSVTTLGQEVAAVAAWAGWRHESTPRLARDLPAPPRPTAARLIVGVRPRNRPLIRAKRQCQRSLSPIPSTSRRDHRRKPTSFRATGSIMESPPRPWSATWKTMCLRVRRASGGTRARREVGALETVWESTRRLRVGHLHPSWAGGRSGSCPRAVRPYRPPRPGVHATRTCHRGRGCGPGVP